MLDLKEIALRIKNLRIEGNYSQAELAEKIYVTRQAISKWESGQTIPSIDNLVQLMKLFDVSINSLLCLDQEPKFNPFNPFENHSRDVVVRKIVLGDLVVDLADIFHFFDLMERYQILIAIKENKLVTETHKLLPRLSMTEKAFLLGITKLEKEMKK